jgi:hypothetical protein
LHFLKRDVCSTAAGRINAISYIMLGIKLKKQFRPAKARFGFQGVAGLSGAKPLSAAEPPRKSG